MVRGFPKQNQVGRDEIPETIEMPLEGAESIEKAVSSEAKPKPKSQRLQRVEAKQPAGPLPDEAQPAPEAPKVAQQDAAAAFMAATSQSQAFATPTTGLLGAVRLGLPDADVYFRTKPIEEVINPDGTKTYLKQAIVSLYKLLDGARESNTEPRLWLVADFLVPAFAERKAKVRKHQLRLAVDRQSTPYLIPVPIDARDIWGSSLRTVLEHSDTKWVKMYSDSKKGRMHELGDKQDLEPSFPIEDFATLYMLALMPVYVDTKEHDIYKRICGA
jgi:hypothetical protein